MNTTTNPGAWDMVETLTNSGLVVPPLGATAPSEIRKLGKWHWGTRKLDFQHELYLFNVQAVAQNIAEHGPLFVVSHGGHGINSYALSLVTTAPSGDVAYFTQDGIFGAYSDDDRDRASINAAYLEIAQEWAELEDTPSTGQVRWLVYHSPLRFGVAGIVDLDALRDGADFESACDEVDASELFENVKVRRGSTIEAEALDPIQAIVPYLAEALRRLKDDSHLVINVRDSIRYVQFATFRPNLRLETIGTLYLDEGEEAWSPDEVVWLADHGWHDADDAGNLWRDWIPADEEEAAAAAVDALVNVHGVTSLEQVWFRSEDDNALDALEEHAPTERRPKAWKPQPTSLARGATINAALGGGVTELPPGSRYAAVVDYTDTSAVLEVLGLAWDEVFSRYEIFRRHDGRWRADPEWRDMLPTAPARSIVPLTGERFDRIVPLIDAATAGEPWEKFEAISVETYWPSHRPDDPDLFDWSHLDTFDKIPEP